MPNIKMCFTRKENAFKCTADDDTGTLVLSSKIQVSIYLYIILM